jgi:DNA-directed RNA polymerase specialized sigma24 family protein
MVQQAGRYRTEPCSTGPEPERRHTRQVVRSDPRGINIHVPPDTLRAERRLTHIASTRLLEWLDDGVDSRGERYVEMRQRLVSYFDRWNRPSPDDLADETLDCIGRDLEKEAVVCDVPPACYCYVVAKSVLLEDIRREEVRLEYLDRCLQELKPEQRECVVEYYRDTGRQQIERRRDMASRLGITIDALGIRASRIRRALESVYLSSNL